MTGPPDVERGAPAKENAPLKTQTPRKKITPSRAGAQDRRLPFWRLRARDALDALRMARVRLCEAEALIGDSAALLWVNEVFIDLEEAEEALLGTVR